MLCLHTFMTLLTLALLKKTGVVIELADRSNVYPKGVLDDVLVQVDDLIFPVDFYILDMPKGCSTLSTQLLLGRPFMKTARTKIDVHEGMLSMEFDGRIVKYRIDAMEESLKENPEPAIVCGVHVISSDGATQKLDSGCKKRTFVLGQEVWLDYSRPRFLPKELRSCESIPLRVIRSLPGGVLELYHSMKGRFKVDGQRIRDTKPVFNPG